ncbi:hypothetical protein Tco_0712242 [Tanacetum coccineum]
MNNWASALKSTYTPPPENSLLAQICDMATFMDWYYKKQGISELTQKDLEGPAYKIVKVFHPDVVHLQFQMEECHKLLTDQVDDAILRYNVSKPLPLGGDPGHVTIQPDFFFNKDLEYLRYGRKIGRPALSISKMKAAYYPDVGLEQMVPDQMWIEEECKYDVAAMYGISHWWFQRQRFYIDRHTSEGDRRAVRTHMRILSVVRIEVFPMYGYNYMKKIVLRRADLKEYVIAERDFKYLYPSDFEDLIPSLTCTKPRPFKFYNFLAHKGSQKMKIMKKPLRKLMHDHGNLHERSLMKTKIVMKKRFLMQSVKLIGWKECSRLDIASVSLIIRVEPNKLKLIELQMLYVDVFTGAGGFGLSIVFISSEEISFCSRMICSLILTVLMHAQREVEALSVHFERINDRWRLAFEVSDVGGNGPGDSAVDDCMKWRDTNGTMTDFIVKCAWEGLRPQCMRRSLKDARQFKANGMLLLNNITLGVESNSWAGGHGCGAAYFGQHPCVVTTDGEQENYTEYCWLFKNNRRTQEELRDAIVVTVRLKLTTFRFKNKAEVHSLLSLWKMPTSFRFYG